jgi:hypothetical protein
MGGRMKWEFAPLGADRTAGSWIVETFQALEVSGATGGSRATRVENLRCDAGGSTGRGRVRSFLFSSPSAR